MRSASGTGPRESVYEYLTTHVVTSGKKRPLTLALDLKATKTYFFKKTIATVLNDLESISTAGSGPKHKSNIKVYILPSSF